MSSQAANRDSRSPNLSEYPPKPRRISIVQSCYVPWKGFFDLIGQCDEYVIFDSVQYVKRHWHNRNRIKTANGVEWLTIPVVSKGRFEQPIDEVAIEKPWAEKHWRALELAYKHARHRLSDKRRQDGASAWNRPRRRRRSLSQRPAGPGLFRRGGVQSRWRDAGVDELRRLSGI
jgi:hypothetical protein